MLWQARIAMRVKPRKKEKSILKLMEKIIATETIPSFDCENLFCV